MNWEYDTLLTDADMFGPGGLAALKRMGSEGWEFVCMRAQQAIFKRPVPVKPVDYGMAFDRDPNYGPTTNPQPASHKPGGDGGGDVHYGAELGDHLGQPGDVVDSYNRAALFGPHINVDGSVTMNARQADRVLAQVRATLAKARADATALANGASTVAMLALHVKNALPWRVRVTPAALSPYADPAGKPVTIAAFLDETTARAFVSMTGKADKYAIEPPAEPKLPTTSVATGPRSPGEYASRPAAIDPSAKRTTIDADDLPSADWIEKAELLLASVHVALIDTTVGHNHVRALFRSEAAAIDWVKSFDGGPAYQLRQTKELLK